MLDPPLPEVAFLGRSNVGKSSLLNALLSRRLARVSAEPGKTTMLNVYLVPPRAIGPGAAPRTGSAVPGATPRGSLYFLDLPGYGYARASKAQRATFQGLLSGVVERPRLAGVVWLLDSRREPSAEDDGMQELLARRGTHVLATLTKGDKLPRGQRLQREAAIRDVLALDPDQIMMTSAKTGDGIPELKEAIMNLIVKREA